MDEKLKKAFDALDEKETDKLLKGIDVKQLNEHGLNTERIMKRVYEQTGADPGSGNEHRKAVVIPWKNIAKIAAAAACFLLVFIGGYLAGGIGKDKPQPPTGNNGSIAGTDNDNNKGTIDNPVTGDGYSDDMTERDGEPDETADGKDGASDKDAADKGRSKDNKKDDKASGSRNNGSPKKDKKNNYGLDNSIMMGIDEDSRYLGMSTDDIEELITASDSVTDMEALNTSYVSVNDMVTDSDYVVKAVKTSSFFKKSDTSHIYRLASKVTVKSVLVNNIEEELNDTIKVNEGIRYNADDSSYTQLAGYTRMRLGYEYILFLKRSASGKSFDIVGVVYGKVPMDKSEAVISADPGYADADKINDVKYIIESARKKYSDYNPDSQAAVTPDRNDKHDKTDKTDKNDNTGSTNNSNNSNNSTNTNNSGSTQDSDKKGTIEKTTPTVAPSDSESGGVSVQSEGI